MSKPKNFGDGRGKYGKFGTGSPVKELPAASPVPFENFQAGFDCRQGREGNPNGSPNSLDIEVNHEGHLLRTAGTVDPTVLAGHKPTQMVLQASLSNLAELVLLDPPYIGVKGPGAIDWTDVGLTVSDRPYALSQFGETLVLGNGQGPVYTREPGGVALATPSIPQARSYATFAGRLFALASIIDGNYEPMGVSWSAASSNPRDFDGTGASFELLLSDASNGDEGVAVRMMNLDLLAFINKNSIWIGTRTGDVFRPAALAPRIIGTGGLTDRTVVSTPIGVVFLSKTGVRAFDGNAAPVISEQINGKLLDLDMDNINLYRMTYDPLKNRISLFTPFCRWDYDIDFQRWYRASMVAVDAAFFTAQIGGTTWAELQAAAKTWADLQTDGTTWLELSARPVGNADLFYLKGDGVVDSQLAQRDPASQSQFGIPILPYWETRRGEAPAYNQLVSYSAVNLEYKNGGDLRIFLPNKTGKLVSVMAMSVVGSPDLLDLAVPMIWTGRGAQIGIQFDTGTFEISKMQAMIVPRSTRINQSDFLPREYRSDFNI